MLELLEVAVACLLGALVAIFANTTLKKLERRIDKELNKPWRPYNPDTDSLFVRVPFLRHDGRSVDLWPFLWWTDGPLALSITINLPFGKFILITWCAYYFDIAWSPD